MVVMKFLFGLGYLTIHITMRHHTRPRMVVMVLSGGGYGVQVVVTM